MEWEHVLLGSRVPVQICGARPSVHVLAPACSSTTLSKNHATPQSWRSAELYRQQHLGGGVYS